MTKKRKSGRWLRVCAPTMTMKTACAFLWTAPVICWGNAGLRATAATLQVPSCRLPRHWRRPFWKMARPRSSGPALSADSSFFLKDGKPTAPRRVRPRGTAAKAGNVCGLCGRKWRAAVTICRPGKPDIPGFLKGVLGAGIS